MISPVWLRMVRRGIWDVRDVRRVLGCMEMCIRVDGGDGW